MKEINLRDYYPFYTTDMIVEVPDEVVNATLILDHSDTEKVYH